MLLQTLTIMYEMSLDFLFLMYYSFDYYYIKIQKIKYLQYHKSYGIYMIRILLNKDMHVLVLHSCTSVISKYEKRCNIWQQLFFQIPWKRRFIMVWLLLHIIWKKLLRLCHEKFTTFNIFRTLFIYEVSDNAFNKDLYIYFIWHCKHV